MFGSSRKSMKKAGRVQPGYKTKSFTENDMAEIEAFDRMQDKFDEAFADMEAPLSKFQSKFENFSEIFDKGEAVGMQGPKGEAGVSSPKHPLDNINGLSYEMTFDLVKKELKKKDREVKELNERLEKLEALLKKDKKYI